MTESRSPAESSRPDRQPSEQQRVEGHRLEDHQAELFRAVRDVRQRTRLALTAARAGVIVIDRARAVLLCDAMVARLLALPPDIEVPLTEAAAQLHPEDRAQVLAVWSGESVADPERGLPFRILDPDGTHRWRSIRVTPLGPEVRGGLVEGVVADIDPEVRREHELRQLRTNLATAQAMTGSGDWEVALPTNPDGDEHVAWSDGLYRIFGLEPGDGPINPELIIARTHPEDRGLVTAAIEGMRTAPFRASLPPYEHRIVRPDGEVRHILVQARKERGLDSGQARVFGVVQDITDRRLTETRLRRSAERFRQLVQASPEIVFRTDARGHVTFTDDGRWEKLTGRSAGEWRGEGWLDSVHADDRAEVRERIDRATATGEAFELRFRLLHVGGGTAHMFSRAMPVKNELGETNDYVGICTDVTPLVESESEKRTLREELLQAQKLEALGTLASGVAHDFNNQIMVIQGYIELAMRELDEGSRVGGFLSRVKMASEAALEVTDGLLTFARKRDGEHTVVDLVALLRDSLSLLRPIVPAAIEFRGAFPETPVWVEASESEIRQILANLVVNARDAMPEGGHLDVSLTIEEEGLARSKSEEASSEEAPTEEAPSEEAGVVAFSVTDDGVGMSEETIARVFEPFFTTKPPGRGTGLGLSVIHGMVGTHGGSIEVESELGRGTTVAVRLPRTERRPVLSECTASTVDPGAGERILVVEDNELIRELVVATCSGAGYEVFEAKDGNEALQVFAEVAEGLALALLDVDLPGRSGVACARAMREAVPDLPVVYLTGNIGNPVLADADPRDPVHEKPCHGDRLLAAVADGVRPRERSTDGA